jgi:hypothetical protein
MPTDQVRGLKAHGTSPAMTGQTRRRVTFAKIEMDLAVLKWMLGVVIAGVASLMIKAFV